MKNVIAFTVLLGIVVAGIYVYAWQAFKQAEQAQDAAAAKLEHKLRRQCADKWPLRGAQFDRCMKQARNHYGL